MPTVHLADRAVITLSGPDAEHFLQNIVTVDLDSLEAGTLKPGALLTPQGKVLFDFLVSRTADDGLLLECRADIADDFVRRLTMYRLRAKASISKRDQSVVSVSWGDESVTSQTDSTDLRDTRFAIPVLRSYAGERDATTHVDAWHALRIAHGVVESGSDYALGDAFPHDILLDQNGGVGFRKGCYVGQEVVSRMQHRGTARRRVLLAHGEGVLPPAGTELTVNGRPVGLLGSVFGDNGLAIARIDRVKEAVDSGTPILAGDVPVGLRIPGWATFTLPRDASAGGEP
jgi:hypothetical protein